MVVFIDFAKIETNLEIVDPSRVETVSIRNL